MIFDVTVEVSLRPGIADPQGATIERALPALGFGGVSGVSVGKSIRFQVEAVDRPTAATLVDDLEQVRVAHVGEEQGGLLFVEDGVFGISASMLPGQSWSDFKSNQAELFKISKVGADQFDDAGVINFSAIGNG